MGPHEQFPGPCTSIPPKMVRREVMLVSCGLGRARQRHTATTESAMIADGCIFCRVVIPNPRSVASVTATWQNSNFVQFSYNSRKDSWLLLLGYFSVKCLVAVANWCALWFHLHWRPPRDVPSREKDLLEKGRDTVSDVVVHDLFRDPSSVECMLAKRVNRLAAEASRTALGVEDLQVLLELNDKEVMIRMLLMFLFLE